MKRFFRAALRTLGYEIVRPGSGESSAHSDFTPEDLAFFARVGPFTMTSRERLYALRTAVEYVAGNRIPGDFVECGVWRGGSTMAAALALMAAGDTSRELYLFDTFEGMPPPQEVDKRYDGAPAAAIIGDRERTKEDLYWAYSPLEDVRENMASTGYPAERVHLVKGMVEETLPHAAPERIAILRLDTDWYESTRHEMEHLYGRVVPGGVVIIDDYGWYQGARKAVDEFLAALAFKPLMARIDRTGRLLVKPGGPAA